MTGASCASGARALRKRTPQGHPIQARHPMPRGTERLVDPRPEAGEVFQGRVQVPREPGSEMGPTPGRQCQQRLEQHGECGIDLCDRQTERHDRPDVAETALGRAILMRQPCPQRRLLGVDHRGGCPRLAALCPRRGCGGREDGHHGLERGPHGQTPQQALMPTGEVEADGLVAHLDVARRDGPGTPERQTGTPPAWRGEQDHPRLGVEQQPMRQQRPKRGDIFIGLTGDGWHARVLPGASVGRAHVPRGVAPGPRAGPDHSAGRASASARGAPGAGQVSGAPPDACRRRGSWAHVAWVSPAPAPPWLEPPGCKSNQCPSVTSPVGCT